MALSILVVVCIARLQRVWILGTATPRWIWMQQRLKGAGSPFLLSLIFQKHHKPCNLRTEDILLKYLALFSNPLCSRMVASYVKDMNSFDRPVGGYEEKKDEAYCVQSFNVWHVDSHGGIAYWLTPQILQYILGNVSLGLGTPVDLSCPINKIMQILCRPAASVTFTSDR